MKISTKMVAENGTYTLNYETSVSENGFFEVSVTKLSGNKIVDKSVVVVEQVTSRDIDRITELMCRGTVTPVTLEEIMRDSMYGKIKLK